MNKFKVFFLITASALSIYFFLPQPVFSAGNDEIPPAARDLVEELLSREERRRINAAIRLSGFEHIEVVRALEKTVIRDNSVSVRRAAIRSLGQIGREEALEVILKSFNSASPGIRMEAVSASVVFSTPAVTKAVLNLAGDPHPMVRQRVVESMISLNYFNQKAQNILLEKLKDISEGVRASAARAAGKRSLQRSLSFLVSMLENDSSYVVRRQAALALGELEKSEESLTALRGALRDSQPGVRIAAALSLAEMGSSAGLNTAIEGMNSSLPEVRADSCRVIARVGPENLRIFLEKALDDMDSRVRNAAAAALDFMDKRLR